MSVTSTHEPIGLVNYGIYLPDNYLTAEDISRLTGIPAEIVEKKMGIEKKHRAGTDEHVSDMAVEAARRALNGIDPEEIDAIIYFGSEYKDYYVWSIATHIQERIKAKNAFAFEIMSLCASFAVAVKVAKDMLLADRELNTILLVMATKEGDLINYENLSTRFMFNFGDGAAACILRRGHAKNQVLGSAILTDGRFSLDVYVPVGGSRIRPTMETVRKKMYLLDVRDIEDMKKNLDPVSLPNFLKVITKACERSGCTTKDIAFLGITHMKPSMHQAILKALGLPEERSVYLKNHGHIQAGDQLIALWEAEQKGLLKDGDLVVLSGAGTGYTWSATCLRWGTAGGAAGAKGGEDQWASSHYSDRY
ncbi:3-oxoacyl-ACP synthase [Desulfovirgula thermocuniculi]|uniref:3-oxoacyl-ACP synthase n=1 Tax=Desulfovirgula thermocuniculi TaxID=348842 RepID=UPI000416A623|nr:3-oxoacyl-ACP synthase [Desulfovirgula thermocuniculi]